MVGVLTPPDVVAARRREDALVLVARGVGDATRLDTVERFLSPPRLAVPAASGPAAGRFCVAKVSGIRNRLGLSVRGFLAAVGALQGDGGSRVRLCAAAGGGFGLEDIGGG